MADGPFIKPWHKDDKNRLQKLINDSKVDITKTDEIEYIDSVRHKYFCRRALTSAKIFKAMLAPSTLSSTTMGIELA